MSDPTPSHSIHAAHPMDPSNRAPDSSSAPSSRIPASSSGDDSEPRPPPPTSGTGSEIVPSNSLVPSNGHGPMYSRPPFHTHSFFVALETSFPTPVARSLMRATRALLTDRVGKVRRAGLTNKDLDNQAYLFRAALSELRSEMTLTVKNDSAAVSAATMALRRDLDRLDQKMKEDIATLKHEIQIELDDRKNETKDEYKRREMTVEDLLNKSIVDISDLRTELESVRWDNMRRAVVGLFALASLVVVAIELRPKPPPPPPPVVATPLTPKDVSQPLAEGLEKMEWTT